MDPPGPFHPTATRRDRTPKHVVRVGVGVLVVVVLPDDHNTDDTSTPRVYCGIRQGSHGAGTLALPGGHLEFGESWETCALREVEEEMHLSSDHLTTPQFGHVVNTILTEDEKHYVTLFLMTTLTGYPTVQAVTAEPDKCQGWDLYSWNDLQSMVQQLDQQRQQTAKHRAMGGTDAPSHQDDTTTTNVMPLFGPLEQLIRDAPETVIQYLQTAAVRKSQTVVP